MWTLKCWFVFNILCACVLTANRKLQCNNFCFFFASQIYGAAVADNLDKNRGVLNRRYFRQVRSCPFLKYMEYCTTDTRECEVEFSAVRTLN